MAVQRFQVSLPQETTLPRDVIVNTLHFNFTSESLDSMEGICNDLCDLYQDHYGSTSAKVTVKAYDIGAPPNFPIAQATKGTANWPANTPREIAICLSFAANKSIPSQRGRIYLAPGAKVGGTPFTYGSRPTSDLMNWALGFYTGANTSLPDIGGVGCEFGVWSPTTGAFHQAQEAWVDDEWDTVRSRGLRATTRVSATREG